MNRGEVWQTIDAERRSLADLFGDLSAEERETALLCTGWRVRRRLPRPHRPHLPWNVIFGKTTDSRQADIQHPRADTLTQRKAQTAAVDRTHWPGLSGARRGRAENATTRPLGCAGPGPPKCWATTNRCRSCPRLSAKAKALRSRLTVASTSIVPMRGRQRFRAAGSDGAGQDVMMDLGSWAEGRHADVVAG